MSQDAVNSRIEAKLDMTLERLNNHGRSIDQLWAMLGKLDVKVASISATVGIVVAIASWLIKH
jgi:hypothetical protein